MLELSREFKKKAKELQKEVESITTEMDKSRDPVTKLKSAALNSTYSEFVTSVKSVDLLMMGYLIRSIQSFCEVYQYEGLNYNTLYNLCLEVFDLLKKEKFVVEKLVEV